MSRNVVYHRIEPGESPPDNVIQPPFRAVVIAEAQGSAEWRELISDWLAQSGCLYMMAWGMGCSSWDDSVDIANIKAFLPREIPEDSFIMTTWHDRETLQETFLFAKSWALHSTIELERTLLLHISMQNRERELLDTFAGA